MRAGSAIADDYMNGRTNLTKAQISEFSLSVTVISSFILDAIVTWSSEFIQRV
jgi:hypothetical protein